MRLIRSLWFLVLVGTAAGIALGLYAPETGTAMKPFADGFTSLVRMMIAPIIFCTVVHGIAAMDDMRRVGRVALKALLYFEVVTIGALAMALAAVDLWRPGAGMKATPQSLDAASVASYAAQAKAQTVPQFLLHIIPDTLLGAFTQTDVLPVLLVSVLFAFALAQLGRDGEAVVRLVGTLSRIFSRMVGFIMWAAPIGAFGSIAFTVGKFGAGTLWSLGALIIEFYLVSLVFVLVVLGGIAAAAGVNIFRLMRYIRDEIVIVAATTSTETVLPRIIEKLQALGCEESIVGLVVPTGYSFNLDGTCLYLATVTVFLAQATNTPLDLGQQVALLAIMLLTSKGAAGVAGAAFIVLAATLAALGTVPVASIALVLGIHRLMAEALTFVNLVGNCVATIVIAKWENAVDEATLNAAVGLRRSPAIPGNTPEIGA